MSFVYRQSISDEMHARIERQRGLLSIQEYTLVALAAALDQPSVAELQRQLVELRAQVARLGAVPQLMGVSARASNAPEMLSF